MSVPGLEAMLRWSRRPAYRRAAWLFLRLAAEGELRQELLERGLDPRAVRRAVRYGRGQELSEPR